MNCATRATGNMSNSPYVRDVFQSLDVRYRPPSFSSRDKIADCVYEVMAEQQKAAISALKKEYKVQPFASAQFDMWENTDTPRRRRRKSFGCLNPSRRRLAPLSRRTAAFM